MFQHEDAFLAAIQENGYLTEKIEERRNLYQEYLKIKGMVTPELMKIFVAVTTLIIALVIFTFQMKLYPLSICLLGVSGLLVWFTWNVYNRIFSSDVESWLDMIKDKDVGEINEFIYASGLKIIMRDEKVCFGEHKKIISLDNQEDVSYISHKDKNVW